MNKAKSVKRQVRVLEARDLMNALGGCSQNASNGMFDGATEVPLGRNGSNGMFDGATEVPTLATTGMPPGAQGLPVFRPAKKA